LYRALWYLLPPVIWDQPVCPPARPVDLDLGVVPVATEWTVRVCSAK